MNEKQIHVFNTLTTAIHTLLLQTLCAKTIQIVSIIVVKLVKHHTVFLVAASVKVYFSFIYLSKSINCKLKGFSLFKNTYIRVVELTQYFYKYFWALQCVYPRRIVFIIYICNRSLPPFITPNIYLIFDPALNSNKKI